jgi:hypothetical protein
MSRPSPWPLVADELLPTALFRLARDFPDVVYAEFFSDAKDLAKGYRKVTFAEFANAVYGAAWWIRENVGAPAKEDGSEALVYFGLGDLRYGVLVFASVVVGYKVSVVRDLKDKQFLNLVHRYYSHLPATEPNPLPNSSNKSTAAFYCHLIRPSPSWPNSSTSDLCRPTQFPLWNNS